MSLDVEILSAIEAELDKGLHQLQHQDFGEAERIFRSILARDNRCFEAAHLLGVTFLESKRLQEAEEQLLRAIEIDPTVPAAHNNLGIVLQELERFEEALECHDKAISLRLEYPQAHNNRGNALKALGRLEEALTSYDRALSLKPDYAHAHNNRGNALGMLQRHQEALESYEKAIELSPRYAQAHVNRAGSLQDLGRMEEAVRAYDIAIAIRPDFAPAFNNRGNAYQDLRRYEQAVQDYDQAIALQPDYAEAFNNRGNALVELARFDEALADYERAIALKPDYDDAYNHRSFLKLRRGQLKEAWPDFEYRWKTKALRSILPPVDAPSWAGENPAGRSILVFAEQGLGDALQFCRYVPLLAEAGGRVTFMPFRTLCPALRSLKGDFRLAEDADSLEDRYDFQCSLMSLPYRFGTELDTIPAATSYLSADPKRVAAWRDRIGVHGVKVGICWQGRPTESGRSAPLAEFYPLSQIPDVRLISLQRINGLEQLDKLPLGMTVETLGNFDEEGAFVDTMAVMENLDLIVTIDSAMVHVAGALGRPVWMALKHVAEWRWFLDRSDSPWYPTLRLFRQKTRGQWASVFENMRDEASGVCRSPSRSFCGSPAKCPSKFEDALSSA